jgi:predicted RNase H-like HicB family nuclease
MSDEANRALGERLVENLRLAVAYQRGEYTPPKVKRVGRYAIVIEGADGHWSAFAPDVPDCEVVGGTVEEVTALLREALAARFAELAAAGETIPPPATKVATVGVTLPANVVVGAQAALAD